MNDVQDTQPILIVPADSQQEKERRQAGLVQFPRRLFLLLLAFAGALLLIWGGSLLTEVGTEFRQSPFFPELVPSMAATVTLLFTSLLLALLLALLLIGIALLERRIQREVGRSGMLLRFGSRLLIFALLTPPAVLLALALRWVLIANIHGGEPGAFSLSLLEGGSFPLAALILALLPALLAAQAVTRRFVLWPSTASGRATVLALLAMVLRQTGGVLSALMVVEVVFNRPGLGNLLLLSVFHNSPALVPVILSLLALLVLSGLLLAELCEWGVQLVTTSRKWLESEARRPSERRLRLGGALCLLLIPLALAAGGLRTEPQLALRQNLQERNELPSPAHPLGTDEMGRDVWARALRAGLNTARYSSGVAALSLIPGFLMGMVAGIVADRKRWLRESVADLLLLPLDVLLFFPLVPGTVAILLLWGAPGGPVLVMAPALLLLPRIAHATRSLWETRALDRNAAWDLLVGLSGLFLGTLFISFSAMVALEYMGLGPQPPLPTLGALLQNGQRVILTNPQQIASIAVMVAAYTLAFYTAADALLDAFNTKEALADLNR